MGEVIAHGNVMRLRTGVEAVRQLVVADEFLHRHGDAAQAGDDDIAIAVLVGGVEDLRRRGGVAELQGRGARNRGDQGLLLIEEAGGRDERVRVKTVTLGRRVGIAHGRFQVPAVGDFEFELAGQLVALHLGAQGVVVVVEAAVAHFHDGHRGFRAGQGAVIAAEARDRHDVTA